MDLRTLDYERKYGRRIIRCCGLHEFECRRHPLLVDNNGTWNLLEEGGGQIVMESILLRVPSMPAAMAPGLETFAESQANGG